MKFYVAGKFEDKERVRLAQRCIEAAGHEITHDWTMAEALGGRSEARDDMEGVKDADALLFVNVDPDLLYAGSLVEIGMAVAWDKPVYFINTEHMKRNVFYHLPGIYSAADAPYPIGERLAEQFAVMNGVAMKSEAALQARSSRSL